MMQARKRDENEKPIVDALRAIGATVDRLNDFGVPDLLVGYRGRTILLEVKNPEKTTKAKSAKSKPGAGPAENHKGQLTPRQVEWWGQWIGAAAHVVETPKEAIAAVKGVDLPELFGVSAVGPGPRVILDIAIARADLTADEADALAGALHEIAAVARARAKENA